MTYLGYVAAAYAIFVCALAWDFLVPRLRIAALLRAAQRARPRRQASVAGSPGESAP